MPTTPPLQRRALTAMLIALIGGGALLTAGCGKVEADRGQIAKDLGLAYGAYTTYVTGPTDAGKLGPSTSPSSSVAKQAAAASHYATRAVEAARTEAAPDNALASFAQKTAAAGASLNAVSQVLTTGRASRSIVDGGQASLDSLLAAARDIGLKVETQRVAAGDLDSPPVP